MTDAEAEAGRQISLFNNSGIYRFGDTNVVFIDPVRVLNRSYSRFYVSPSVYYSRFFQSSSYSTVNDVGASNCTRKRKRGKFSKKTLHELNSREIIADQRHQEVRPVLVNAHETLLEAGLLLEMMRNLRNDGSSGVKGDADSNRADSELDFVNLGRLWQKQFYEIILKCVESCDKSILPLFDNIVSNEGSDDVEAEIFGCKFILPKKSCFFMSDIGQIRNLVPAEADCGFNLIVIDPPWENSSAHQKLKYKTLPNRYFLSIPIKKLTHKVGALVALWVTNREKLRTFVENELFPKWGVKHAATFYWLKVKADGSLIGELDLFHHRPYECLLLGFSHAEDKNSEHLLRLLHIPNNQVFISIPGDYSRKPPVGELLVDYIPGSKPARCLELFSREMLSGWTSWGNEPLHFQRSKFFVSRGIVEE
ncbi:methyltransferase-like protein 2 [Dorcoceras hygrometricum]|uniref:Methyltransferase-like protein 2 n=1 Tax=Dorcoceras hygrometricum TaxID=472368 RepID=A0A2Z7AN75_9LAMI|nr:methyltransferase-like protein 2 [Dorcoceras hygrometricum]